MDFFGAQEKAQKQTRQAIGLFAVAVAATILAVYAALSGILLMLYGQLGIEFVPSNPTPVTLDPIIGWVVTILLGLNIGFLLNAVGGAKRSSIANSIINFIIGFGFSAFVSYLISRNIAQTPWLQQLFGDKWLEGSFWEPQRFAWTIFITVSIVFNASLMRLTRLFGGSDNVLKLIGAKIVNPMQAQGKEYVLHNVIEEMAIASGHPIPTVGIMPEEGLNAFAIGANTNDCAIVVTQGLLDSLTRDELQAVIGHEFSHLLHGDSKINMRLHGWVYGLLAISAVGKAILRGSFGGRHSRYHSGGGRTRSSGGGGAIAVAIITFAIALIIIGAIGFLVGRIIQAMISRQREFLADAASVQFTRNPDAMVKALGRIKQGASQIRHPQASGFAHCFFANSSKFNFLSSLTATHPPVEERMGQIDPNYESVIKNLKPVEKATPPQSPDPKKNGAGAKLVGMATMLAGAGIITSQQLSAAQGLGKSLDTSVKEALESAEGSINLILAAALDDDAEVRRDQLAMLHDRLGTETITQIGALHRQLKKQPDEAFIPTAQIALSHIKPEDIAIREGVCGLLEEIIAYDDTLTLQEAFYAEFVAFCLEINHKHKEIPAHIAASQVISRLIDEQGVPDAAKTFLEVTEGLVLQNVSYKPQIPSADVRMSLPALRALPFIQRRELLIAADRAVKADGKLEPMEAEYLRALAILMECALPANLQ